MCENPAQYLFYVHKTVPRWRLVITSKIGFPSTTKAEEWRFTRARTADDTNTEVREMIDADGYCLFKIGGTFADIERDRISTR